MGKVLKADQVNLEGVFRIDIDHSLCNQPAAAGANTIQAHLADSQPGFAVIEVSCSCGTKTNIRCDYIQQTPRPGPVEAQVNGENENEN